MELIYLWTEGYKNLSGGYSLSGQFKVNANENKISLESNLNYINNFFHHSNNVNVSALIGENGCGKSSILKLIIELFYNQKTNKIGKSRSYLIYMLENKYYCIGHNSTDKIYINKKAIKLNRHESNIYTLYINNMLDTLKDSFQETWVDSIYHKADDYDMPILLEPYKSNNVIDVNRIDYLVEQRIKSQLEDDKPDILNEIFKPVSALITIDKEKTIGLIREFLSHNDNNPYFLSINIELIDVIERIERIEKQEGFIKKRINRELERSNFEAARRLEVSHNKLRIRNETDLNDILYSIPIDIVNAVYIISKTRKYNSSHSGKNAFVFVDDEFKISHDINDTSYKTEKIRRSIEFQEYLSSNNIKNKDVYNTVIKINNDLIPLAPSWLMVSLSNKNGTSYNTLSSGEKLTYRFYSTIEYLLRNLKSRKENSLNSYENIVILLDEVDIGLHPKWQRDFIYNLVNFLGSYSKDFSFHVICTSHSPFIASDLPKDNITFLKKGCGALLGENTDTFAENIHNLLSDSFFMEGHLLTGKFAEHKVKTAFNTLSKITESDKDELSKNDIEKYYNSRNDIIKLSDIVGDEFLKKAMRNSIEQADSLSRITNESNIYKVVTAAKNNPELLNKWLNDLL